MSLLLRLGLKCRPRLPDITMLGSRGNLCKVLSKHPQKIGSKVVYALTGGWAVELLSGKERKHKDIDIVVLDKELGVKTDKRRPESYFGQLSVPTKLFRRNCIVSLCTDLLIYRPRGYRMDGLNAWVDFVDPVGEVLIVIPEILAIAKLSGSQLGETAREKDIYDCVALLRRGPLISSPIMSEESARFAFGHLVGMPHKMASSLTHDFIRLNRQVFNASFLEAEAAVREFHDRLRDIVGPNRGSHEIPDSRTDRVLDDIEVWRPFAPRTIEGEAGNMKIQLPVFNSETSPWFAFGGPQDMVYPALRDANGKPLIDFRGKKMLAVLADGDQGLMYAPLGLKSYTAFDVSRYATAFYELKLAAIKELTREEYIDFFIPSDIARRSHGFTFKEKEVVATFGGDRREINRVKNKYFVRYLDFYHKVRWMPDLRRLSATKARHPEDIEEEFLRFIEQETNPAFAEVLRRHRYEFNYQWATPLMHIQRETSQYSWEVYKERLREHLSFKATKMLDPIVLNAYYDENEALQPYARLVTVEEITRQNMGIVKYLVDDALYQKIQRRIRSKRQYVELRSGRDTDVLASAVAAEEKYDLLSLSNVPSYRKTNEERRNLFEQVSALLSPGGMLMFHINNPEGKTLDSNKTREGVYLGLKPRKYGLELVQHIPIGQMREIYVNECGSDAAEYGHAFFIYRKAFF